MDNAINMQSVYVTDFVGIAILIILLISRGWILPGRKRESRYMLIMLLVSVLNCAADVIAR